MNKKLSISNDILIAALILFFSLSFCFARNVKHPDEIYIHTILALFIIAAFFIVIFFSNSINLFLSDSGKFFEKKQKLALILVLLIFIGLVAAFSHYLGCWRATDEMRNENGSEMLYNKGFREFIAGYPSLGIGIQDWPLLSLIGGIFYKLLGKNIMVLRFIETIFGAMTLFFTYLVANKFYGKRVAFFSIFILSINHLFFRSSGIWEWDIPLTFFFVFSIWLFVISEERWPYFFILGIAVGLGTLVKYPLMLIWPIIFFYLFIKDKKNIFSLKFIMSILISLVIVLPWLFFCYKYNKKVMNMDAITRFCDYCIFKSEWRRFFLYYLPDIFFAWGGSGWVIFFLSLFEIKKTKKDFNKFLLIWIAVIFVVFIFTQPTRRYFLPAFPALAIISGIGLNYFWKQNKKYITILCIANSLMITVFYWFRGWS